MFETPDEEIRMRFMELKKARDEAGINVKLGLSREYHFDKSLIESLKNKSVILMGGKTMLVEFSHDTPFSDMQKAMLLLRKVGIQPLIAHIERYAEIQDDIATAEELRKMGALIQVNAASVLGDEGSKQKKTVKALMKADMVYAVASDAHNTRERQPNLGKCEIYLKKKYGEEYAHKVMYANPMSLITRKDNRNEDNRTD